VRRLAHIGANATMLPGVDVREGSLVVARAVVVDHVPPGGVVVRNPARVVKPVNGLVCRAGVFARPYARPPYQT